MSVWANNTTLPAGFHSVFMKTLAYGIEYNGSSVKFNIGSGGSWNAETQATVSAGWHHLTGTFDGTTARLYVDGVLRHSLAGTLGDDAGFVFSIGCWQENTEFFQRLPRRSPRLQPRAVGR